MEKFGCTIHCISTVFAKQKPNNHKTMKQYNHKRKAVPPSLESHTAKLSQFSLVELQSLFKRTQN